MRGNGRLRLPKSRLLIFFYERCEEAFRPVLRAPLRPQPRDWAADAATLTWLGHATVLINFFGVTVLTDPVFSKRVGLQLGLGILGPKRFVAPALTVGELPPVDVLLLSHAHMDHLDLPTLRRLPPAFAVTAPGTLDLLRKTPFSRAKELRWGDSTAFRSRHGELRIQAFEVKHWGARLGGDLHRGYNGYVLEREGVRLVFGGDTAFTHSFGRLRSHGTVAAALMPIAAYRPWIRNHCTPEEALQMADAAGAGLVLPIHHSTFKLSDEPMTEPMERMQTALRHEPDRLGWSRIGETCRIA